MDHATGGKLQTPSILSQPTRELACEDYLLGQKDVKHGLLRSSFIPLLLPSLLILSFVNMLAPCVCTCESSRPDRTLEFCDQQSDY